MAKKLSYTIEQDYPGRIWFKYVGSITEDGAMRLQEGAGYHPHGYGFYDFACINNVARWHCFNHCD